MIRYSESNLNRSIYGSEFGPNESSGVDPSGTVHQLAELYESAVSQKPSITRRKMLTGFILPPIFGSVGAGYLGLANCYPEVEAMYECYTSSADVAPLIAGTGFVLLGVKKAVSAVQEGRAYHRQNETWFRARESSGPTGG